MNSIHQSMYHNVVNEKSFRDLETLEDAISKLRRRLLDPLKESEFNEATFNPERMTVLASKRANQLEIEKALVITFVKPEGYEASDANSFLIMNSLRETYFSDFTGYSRHLTLAPRTTSKYYNSHQIKDIVMLQTGGFAREHKALPKWRVQNSSELLNFQVAQLRRTYSFWLQRHSMNDDIKKTLFSTKVPPISLNYLQG